MIDTNKPSACAVLVYVTIVNNEYSCYVTPDGDIENLEFEDCPFNGDGLFVNDIHIIHGEKIRPFMDVLTDRAMEKANEKGLFETDWDGAQMDRAYENIGEGR